MIIPTLWQGLDPPPPMILKEADTKAPQLAELETYLAAPGALPDPDLLTALIPTWLTTLLTTHQAVATEIEAAALYATTPGD